MATSFSKIGVLGVILIFLTLSAGTSTWARQLNDEEGVIEAMSIARTSSSAKSGANDVPRWVITMFKDVGSIYNPEPNPLIECGTENSLCTDSFGFYDSCCDGYRCYIIISPGGECKKKMKQS